MQWHPPAAGLIWRRETPGCHHLVWSSEGRGAQVTTSNTNTSTTKWHPHSIHLPDSTQVQLIDTSHAVIGLETYVINVGFKKKNNLPCPSRRRSSFFNKMLHHLCWGASVAPPTAVCLKTMKWFLPSKYVFQSKMQLYLVHKTKLSYIMSLYSYSAIRMRGGPTRTVRSSLEEERDTLLSSLSLELWQHDKEEAHEWQVVETLTSTPSFYCSTTDQMQTYAHQFNKHTTTGLTTLTLLDRTL